jgi:hypothetical protein
MELLFYLVSIIILIWLAGLTFYLYKIKKFNQRLVEGVNKGNLTNVLDKILDNLDNNKLNIEDLRKRLDNISDEVIRHVQKVGLLRFNPFEDTGGDQSFVLAILDGKDTGIVLTSLHNRGITRWYAKKVEEGRGVDHELSDEEKKAIKQAVKLKLEKKGKI